MVLLLAAGAYIPAAVLAVGALNQYDTKLLYGSIAHMVVTDNGQSA
jgi:hypothetical protein